MLAAIQDPFVLLKYHMNCITPPGYSVLLAPSLSSWDVLGVHSPLVSAPVVLHWLVSILITFLSSKASQCVASSALHPDELFNLQSGLHALNCSMWNTMPLHYGFPLLYHPLDLQAHQTTATLSENTGNRVNGILL